MTHEPIDVQAELARWRRTGLPVETLAAAADHMEATTTQAFEEERELVEALRRELAYSLCWPEELGDQSLVSRAYMLMGQVRFPTPGDPEPVRQTLEAHEERLGALSELLAQVRELRKLL